MICKLMKKLVLGLCVVAGVSTVSFGQQNDGHTYRIISKDVQRLQIKNEWYEPARVTTGDVAAVGGKGVNQLNAKRSDQRSGTVKTGGTPSWVISKGVARMQYEKSNKTN
jgi:hypothetical protein